MKKVTVILFVIALSSSVALAGDMAWGARLGYTDSGALSQFHFGGHAVVHHLSPNVTIVPSAELGVGDGTYFALNGDVLYEFTELASSPWSFYGGGGPMLGHYTNDGYDSTDFALNLVAGATYELEGARNLFGELRLGLEDAPDVKLTFGITFQ